MRIDSRRIGLFAAALLWLLTVTTATAQMGVDEWVTHIIRGPATGLGYMMHAVSFILGVGFLLGTYIQYQAHRDNPQQVRLSTPILLFCAGLLLILLPLLAWVAEGGSFLKPAR